MAEETDERSSRRECSRFNKQHPDCVFGCAAQCTRSRGSRFRFADRAKPYQFSQRTSWLATVGEFSSTPTRLVNRGDIMADLMAFTDTQPSTYNTGVLAERYEMTGKNASIPSLPKKVEREFAPYTNA